MHRWTCGVYLALAATSVAATPEVVTLKQAFESAWRRQPEARALDSRRDAALSRRDVANGWTAQPPVVELSARTTQTGRDTGKREFEAGIGLPLWLPGESERSAALADAELRAVDGRNTAAKLRIASAVRDAWWTWQRARVDRELAARRLAASRALAADVARRVGAGDLARSDQYQAEGAAASAVVSSADAAVFLVRAAQQFRALVDSSPPDGRDVSPEPLPAVPADGAALESRHPAMLEARGRVEYLQRSAALLEVQTRANPELVLGTMRERGTFSETYSSNIAVGVRIPLGSSDRLRARKADTRAELLETEAQLGQVHTRIVADVETARQRLAATRTQLEAAERRAALAHETRGFFERSFQLGETDLPTRLRIELDAFEAERQAARTRIDAAEAVSQLRQALGLIPE